MPNLDQAQINPTEITPTFNPGSIPETELYLRDISPDGAKNFSMAPHSSYEPDLEAIDIYRLEHRERVESGVGMVASRALIENADTLGDIAGFKMMKHMVSHQAKRSVRGEETPFVSFSSDPKHLAEKVILKSGFGIKDGSDSVIVKARVHPSRILSNGAGERPEVLLLGGVAPEEYEEAYELGDFVLAHVDAENHVDTYLSNELMKPQDAMAQWKAKASEEVRDKAAA